MQHISD